MQFINFRNISAKNVLLCIALIISSLPFLVSCDDKPESDNSSPATDAADSFTFFDLGKTTQLTKGVRGELGKKLGRDAIERRSILDLEINYKGFLKKYFPELDALNQKINFPPRERVDHNTVKLMYRYAQKKNVPFDYVELVFSNYTDMPVLFDINFKADEADIVGTLRSKYGNPNVITWNDENGQSTYWKKDGEYLIVSRVPNQFGKYDYQIVIYYTDNLKQLIETERKEKDEKELQRAKTGSKAF